MSKELKAFLRAWLWWAMTGAEEDESNTFLFERALGLCSSVYEYARGEEAERINAALVDQFIADGLDNRYPFGVADFDYRVDSETMHLCPKRVGWVIEVLEANP